MTSFRADGKTSRPVPEQLPDRPGCFEFSVSTAPDDIVNGRSFVRLHPRNRGKFLLGLLRIRRGLDPTNHLDLELADVIDSECDRLSSLMAWVTR